MAVKWHLIMDCGVKSLLIGHPLAITFSIATNERKIFYINLIVKYSHEICEIIARLNSYMPIVDL